MVIGAGQAGLSAAYHLRRRGFAPAVGRGAAERSYVVLDAGAGPGGAWRHRWRSLRMSTVNGIFDLPGLAKPPLDRDEPSAAAVPRYFAAFERAFELPILRPVTVAAVRRVTGPAGAAGGPGPAGVAGGPDSAGVAGGSEQVGSAGGGLLVETDHGSWIAQAIINATGTWTNPNRPHYPGQETFLGRQLHVAEYLSAEEFAGQQVAIVGGGVSAIQLLAEISEVTTTSWFTRREPVWLPGEFDPLTVGRRVVAMVDADVRRGLPAGSIVGYTGLAWTPYARAAAARGALLHLRNRLGGITMDGTAVAGEPRVHLIGYGPSQSTVGANRAGRDAVNAIEAYLSSLAGAVPGPAGPAGPLRHQ